ncbi:cation diffusion facilitator transporter family protein [Clostridium argentinense CDC 2741]|uniref:Cation diffusion facilitator transporter family protein n=1 Tax=Clostridium argentinense CDC 2741 TaxID=1418104 RepID=A0A0C1R237_9CLOT|nr:cation diffusion facilitator family transporter [Clostridium argentinense]ARC84288.1 cation-efflux pump [Clostridium argentinense]KIE44511.1 cation diffusion facilitator transporter family protein [Clostridium argentinense CDC 2741]NFF38249.1 cation transporter [Clostridium argentinense]NFP49166.1 cation transporter [Clostridium argentinense]NFP71554.1 cation transporter [Clostridium argentinense]
MDNYKKATKVSIITVIINTVLAIFKVIAGIVGKSSAMIADGIHTFSDIATTVVVIIGLKISNKDADEKHPYGHEKFEPEISKIVSLLLAGTGVFLAYNAIQILLSGNLDTPKPIALYAALTSIAVKEAMYWYTIITARKVKSIAMEADAWHHRSDAISSVGTLIGIAGARMGFKFLDPVAGIIVSLILIKVGVEFYLKATDQLVDQSADDKVIEQIKEVATSIEGVKKIHDLKTRKFGNKIYVDIEIQVDKRITVEEGHHIADLVHDSIEETIEDVKHCMIHVEPD